VQYGYARVSTLAQRTDRQVEALHAVGVDVVFTDKQSGKDFNRIEYARMIDTIQEGDVLYVKSLDRLGRNYSEIIEQWRILTKEKKVDVVILDMPLLDTRTEKNLHGAFISDLVLQILAFVAENERSYILERQREGIESARRRGVKFGRRPRKRPKNFVQIAQYWLEGQMTTESAANAVNMPPTTFRRHVQNVLGDYYEAIRRQGSTGSSPRG
jgi:DNA invertase Pin-like site-specific DNA recombinase